MNRKNWFAWDVTHSSIEHLIRNEGVENFLNWNEIKRTMHFRFFPSFIYEYLTIMIHRPNWKHIITTDGRIDSNKVHNAYHLMQFEESTNTNISEYTNIFEFGGGYGCLAKIIKTLNPHCDYTIFDVPTMSKIQKYYLRDYDVRIINDIKDITKKDMTLLIGAWSISEVPIVLREDIINRVCPAHYFIGYQNKLNGIDNALYFNKLKQKYPAIVWKHKTMWHFLLKQYYLFGRMRYNGDQ